MKRLGIIALLLTTCTLLATAKGKVACERMYAFRYYLADKHGSGHSLMHAGRFLSQRSIERRRRQGLAPDSTDLPLTQAYVDELCASGARVVARSRWHNTVVMSSADSALLVSLTAKPFVRDARLVYVSPDSIDRPEDVKWNVHDDFNKWDSVKNDPYGMARQQIEMLGGDSLHEAGFTGRGLTIAVLDGGFQNYDRLPCFGKTRIAGVRDFVPRHLLSAAPADPRVAMHAIDHGTRVLSAMAARAPEVVMGTAPDADYWLLRCEEPLFEQPIEEDLWTMAAEYADSVGADVINSSLGYYAFDRDLGNYRLQDLDGTTAHISRSASMLAGKGMVLCNSAGNSGMGQWKKIGVPADARDIITVGAIDRNRKIAAFSSVGPSQDWRVKPDVVALGAPAQLISGRGRLNQGMGTSFATPLVTGLVTCLWQALPRLKATDIIELVRESGTLSRCPDNIFGYGTPNFWHAYNEGKQREHTTQRHEK